MRLDAAPFNLDATLCCGQVFRWDKREDWWYGVTSERVLKIRQVLDKLDFANTDPEDIRHYFSLDHDLRRISESIGKDQHIKAAIQHFWGLRIIRQDPWECLTSFICATYKSIVAIKQMLNKLAIRFGTRIALDGFDFYTFPAPETLAESTEKDLMSCGLGYRAKYLLETSRIIDSGGCDLAALKKLPYLQARKKLCELPGVGPKVADCILLFSLDRLDAFPVDVWVKRIMLRYYTKHLPAVFVEKLSSAESMSSSDYAELNQFGRVYFGEYAGYAQEYLYHYERLKRHISDDSSRFSQEGLRCKR